jgi:hypothetical protein
MKTLKPLKYYSQSVETLPIRYTTHGKQLKMGSHGRLWVARVKNIAIGVLR